MALLLSKITNSFNSLRGKIHPSSSCAKTPAADILKKVSNGAKTSLGDSYDSLLLSVKKNSSKALEIKDGVYVPKQEKFLKKLFEAGRDFLEMPLDLIDSAASKFPNSKLYNSKILKNHRAHILKENKLKALQGLYEDGSKFLSGNDSRGFDKFLDLKLNSTMAPESAVFDTKKERFNTRLISGITAAVFLGTDFYNSAKLKGKTDEEAKAQQHKKQAQEIKENLIEGVVNYGVAATLSKQVNANIITSALISTGVGLFSRILSRKMSNMPLTRIKVPDNSINEFVRAAKTGEEYKTSSEMEKDKKKPILSIKNILLACGGVIAAGFGLHIIKRHTKFGLAFDGRFKKLMADFHIKNVEKVYVDKDDFSKITKILEKSGEKEYANKLNATFGNEIKNKGKAYLGSKYKTVKLFNKIEVKLIDLKTAPLAPFKMVKNIVTYPYEKIAKKIAIGTGHFTDNSFKFKLDDRGMKNLYLRFKEFERKYGSDPQKLEKEFGKYVNEMRLASLNNATVSKVDNSKIAVMAQTLGTLTGIGFNMNDEFNASVKNGDSKANAEKAARKRGINKFTRMTTQMAITDTLNNLFKRQYQGSLFGAGVVVAVSTVLTDMVSRLLTAMPTKKMDKDGLVEYQENHKKGGMAWYYKAIDKLSS